MAVAGTLAAALLAGCSDNPTDTTDPNTITQPYHLQATINGATETQQGGGSGASGDVAIHMAGSYGSSSNDGYLVVERMDFRRYIFTGSIPSVDTTFRSMRIAFIKVFPERPYGSQTEALVSPTMGYGSSENETDGVEISWRDASGTDWCSSWGSGDQTGSTFTVTSHERIEYPAGSTRGGKFNTKGTFTCKLYDKQGHSMDVTNGSYSLQTVWLD